MRSSPGVRIAVAVVVFTVAILGRDRFYNLRYRDTPLVDREPSALSLPALDGRQYSLQPYHGKIVVVDVWATWCPSCVKLLANIERMKNKYADRDVVFLTVNVDEVSKTMSTPQLREYVDRQRLTVPVLLADNETAYHWSGADVGGQGGLPQTYVLDARGKVRFQATSPDAGQIQAVVNRLLEE